VDVIVAGHSHAVVAHRVAGVAITESFSGGRAFGRVDLSIDRGAKTVTATRIFPPRDLCAREDADTGRCDTGAAGRTAVQATYENAPVVPDSAIDALLAPVLEQVRVLKAQPIGVTLDTPIRRQTPVSPLGNVFTDALLAAVPGADVSLNNSSGGLRADLPAGPLTFGSVYEVMPFDNLVVELRLTGQQLRRVFAAYVQSARRVVGFSGVTVRARCSAGLLDVAMLRPSGVPIRDDETVRVVVSDFLATGGDGILAPIMPRGGFPVDQGAPLLRDAFASYLKGLKGPLREGDFLDTGRPRLVVEGGQPLKCAA
jgi:5'-nucleotidase